MLNKSTNNNAKKPRSTALTTYQAGVMQATVHRSLQKYCDQVLNQYGISKSQWLVIGTVLDHGSTGIRLSELAKELDTTMAYLTNSINLLESKNILIRTVSRNDTRAKYVTVNPSFASQCKEIEETLRVSLRKLMYSNVNNDDFRIYMKVLHQIADFEEFSHLSR